MNKTNTHSGQLITSFAKLNEATTSNAITTPATNTNNSSHETVSNSKKHFLLSLYKGKRVDNMIKSMKKTVHKLLLETVNTQAAYTERKRSNCFQIKVKVNWITNMT